MRRRWTRLLNTWERTGESGWTFRIKRWTGAGGRVTLRALAPGQRFQGQLVGAFNGVRDAQKEANRLDDLPAGEIADEVRRLAVLALDAPRRAWLAANGLPEEPRVQPIAPPCSTMTYPGNQCRRKATHWLRAPDGKLNPGGYICEEHGAAVVEEYREKLGEEWELVELTVLP